MSTNLDGYPDDFAALLADYNQQVETLMARLESGGITAKVWKDEMAALLARYSQAARLLGGGSVQLLPEETAAIRGWMDQQLKYLDGFEAVIQAASGAYNPAWLSRAMMYGASTVIEYWEGATMGLPLPAQPAQGTQCLSNCRCKWRIEWIDKKAGDADAYWEINPEVENCQTCKTRHEMWYPVRIRKGDLQ